MVFKTWTYGEKQNALRKITEFKKDEKTGKTTATVDPWRMNDEMVLATLVEWDLDKPINLETLRGLEPPEIVEDMIEYTQRLNGVLEEERKK